jgi:hypothetical protein
MFQRCSVQRFSSSSDDPLSFIALEWTPGVIEQDSFFLCGRVWAIAIAKLGQDSFRCVMPWQK